MSGQTVPSNASDGSVPTQVAITGMPTRARVTMTLTNPRSLASFLVAIGRGPSAASVWARTATTPYGYTEDIPLLVMTVSPGQTSIEQELPLDMAYYNTLFARLDMIDRSQRVAASVVMTV